jgi:hypothetical protein
VEALGQSDHPTVARMLADAVKHNAESSLVLAALVKAAKTVNWDVLHQALCEPLLLSTQNPKLSGNRGFSDAAWAYLVLVEAEAPVAAIDGMLKLLAKYEENRRQGYGQSDWDKKLRACLKLCTGVDKPAAKDWAAYWKTAKTAQAGAFTYVLWCPATGQRWDRKGNDAKAFCSHHEDKQAAQGDNSAVALTRNK